MKLGPMRYLSSLDILLKDTFLLSLKNQLQKVHLAYLFWHEIIANYLKIDKFDKLQLTVIDKISMKISLATESLFQCFNLSVERLLLIKLHCMKINYKTVTEWIIKTMFL